MNTLTKREQIAAMAMQGYLSSFNHSITDEVVTGNSIFLADALLAKLKATEPAVTLPIVYNGYSIGNTVKVSPYGENGVVVGFNPVAHELLIRVGEDTIISVGFEHVDLLPF